ncbi:hypothetical protein HMPREF0156_00916 [Bacteroidetes oral taxon 274 str. F0058]|nr:hypothetical protein HMPREF0156_00916 [Bacteroidetes oral taxon 274 str. F0058]
MQQNYIKVTIHTDMEEYLQNILAYRLLSVGYGGIEETSSGMEAYCSEDIFDERALIAMLPDDAKYRIESIEPSRWERFIKAN